MESFKETPENGPAIRAYPAGLAELAELAELAGGVEC